MSLGGRVRGAPALQSQPASQRAGSGVGPSPGAEHVESWPGVGDPTVATEDLVWAWSGGTAGYVLGAGRFTVGPYGDYTPSSIPAGHVLQAGALLFPDVATPAGQTSYWIEITLGNVHHASLDVLNVNGAGWGVGAVWVTAQFSLEFGDLGAIAGAPSMRVGAANGSGFNASVVIDTARIQTGSRLRYENTNVARVLLDGVQILGGPADASDNFVPLLDFEVQGDPTGLATPYYAAGDIEIARFSYGTFG